MKPQVALALSIQRLFLLTIVLKIAASLGGWWLGSPWTLGFVVPLGLMAGYIAVGLRRPDSGVSDEKFADSCYYLGFIFTISSILVALLDLPAIATKLPEISIRFGAAMVSTVLGLIVRVYLVNFRPEFQDGVRSAETGLLDAVRTFRMHLDLAVEKLSEFQAQVGDASRLAVAQSELAIRDSGAAQIRQLGALAEQVSADYHRHFEASTEHLKGATQTLATALYEYTQNLVAATGRFETRAEQFMQALDARIEDAALPEDYFAARLEPAVAGLSRSIAAAGGEMTDLAFGLRSRMGTIADDLTHLGEQTAAAAVSLERVRDTAGAEADLIAAARQQAEVLQSLGAALLKLENTVGRSLAAIGAMEQSVRKITEDAGQMAAFNREAAALVQRQTELAAGTQRSLAEWLPRRQEDEQRLDLRLEAASVSFERAAEKIVAALADSRAVAELPPERGERPVAPDPLARSGGGTRRVGS